MLKYEYKTTSCNGINGTVTGDHLTSVSLLEEDLSHNLIQTGKNNKSD